MSRVDALIQETRIRGIIKGKANYGLLMDWLALNEEIKPDQAIITSGLSDLFPAGLLIGRIEQVIFNESDVFKKAEIEPAVDFEKLEKVFIIRWP